MTSIEVVVADPGSQPTVVKRAGSGPDATHLAHEAEVLDAVRGAGVVDLVRFEADADGAELEMTWAGHHTLATLGRIPTRAAADLVATLADTVARLHGLRIAHTRITADHVVLGVDQQPILCGFSRACRGDAQAIETDIVALGDLLVRLVGEDTDPASIVPDRRSRHRSEPERAVLLTLADRASARGLGGRPSAASFGQSVRELLPKARPARRTHAPARTDVRRLAPILGGVLGAVLVLSGARELLGDRRSPEPPRATSSGSDPIGTVDEPRSSTPTTSSTLASVERRATTTSVPLTAAITCPDVALPSADTDGDGCPNPYAVVGSNVSLDGRTFEVGRPGDLVAVADWNCDGRATPALVRPPTGEVFVFADWARPARRAHRSSNHRRRRRDRHPTGHLDRTVPGARRDPPGRHDRGGADPAMTSRLRTGTVVVAWYASLATSIVMLVELGDGPLSAPPMTDPGELRRWVGERDAVTAAFALVRIAALVVAGYLVLVTLLGIVARRSNRSRLVRLVDLGTLPAVRQLVGGLAGVGLTASAVTLVIGGTTPSRDGGSELVESQDTDRPLVIERVDGSRLVLERLGDEHDHGEGTATMRVVPDEAPPPVQPAPWVSVAGESMWSKAGSVLAETWHRPPSDGEVAPYWLTLVEANRSRFADPSNPDLIFVGQAFELPPPPPAP